MSSVPSSDDVGVPDAQMMSERIPTGGPDIVQNGIALSATAHWLFDRHLISVSDDYRLLVAHNRVPQDLHRLFPPAGEQIRLPNDRRNWPRQDFVARHRERFVGSAPS